MTIQSYKDLVVWQKSLGLTKMIYKLSSDLPKSELYGLISQMQRSAVSIPSNIAEGHQRNNTAEYRHFLGIARGSTAELETQLLITREVYVMNVQQELDLLYEVQKMLSSLIKKLTPSP